MQAINILLIVLGLIVCFGGIYFRKPVAAIAGFVNGLFLGGIVLVILMLTYSDVGSEWVIVLVIALLVAGICVVFDKFFAALSAFISSLLALAIIALSICEYDTIGAGLIVAAIGAVILAVVSYMYYKYSFAIVTAFTGGLSAAIGITFLSTGNSLDSYVSNILWGESSGLGMIIVITLVLTVAGSYVQITGMKKQEELKRRIEAGEAIASGTNFIISQDVMAEIKKYPITFYTPILIYVLFGLINIIQQNSEGWYAWYSVVYWVDMITDGIALACLTYAAFRLSTKYCIIIQIAYALGYLLQHIYAFAWDVIGTIIGLFGMTLIWGIVYLIRNKIKEEPWKPLFTIIVASVIFVFVLPALLEGGYYFNIYTVITIAVSILGFAYICNVYDKMSLFKFMAKDNDLPSIDNSSYIVNLDKKSTDNVTPTIEPVTNSLPTIEPITTIEPNYSINKTASNNMASDAFKTDNNSTSATYCTYCGAEINSDWMFCKNCGKKTNA